MQIVAMSDTHMSEHEIKVPDGDVLIFAGDMCNRGGIEEVAAFGASLMSYPHKHKIVIAGNHDRVFEQDGNVAGLMLHDCIYLQDGLVEIDGVKIYGSPWQPEFCGWAFNLPRGEDLKRKWDMIPEDTDILVTHGPPYGILDMNSRNYNVGSKTLLDAVQRVQPKYHIFGHIHEGYGMVKQCDTYFINASVCDGEYIPNNDPIVFEF